jgi:hypothetical protein
LQKTEISQNPWANYIPKQEKHYCIVKKIISITGIYRHESRERKAHVPLLTTNTYKSMKI